jgi:nucleoporin NUP159
MAFGMTIKDISPNPGSFPNLCAILSAEGTLKMWNVESGSLAQVFDNVSSISWSKLGKQIACGLSNGDIVQVTPEGAEKNRIPPPQTMTEEEGRVTGIS